MYRGNFDIESTNEVVISEKEIKMNLAGGLLFMIWCSIVFFTIGAWAFWTIMKQDKTLLDDWDDDDFSDWKNDDEDLQEIL